MDLIDNDPQWTDTAGAPPTSRWPRGQWGVVVSVDAEGWYLKPDGSVSGRVVVSV